MNSQLIKIALTILISALAIVSCKKEEPEPQLTDNERGRNALYSVMNEWYLWIDRMPQVTHTNYADPYSLLEALRVRPDDRWSFVTDYKSFMDYYMGSFVGHGIRIGLDSDDKARIVMIYKNSPLYKEPYNVRRGWIIESVNGTDIAALLAAGNFTAYNLVMGPPEKDVENSFVFTRPDNTQLSVSSKKSEFQVNSVLTYDTLHLSTGVTGYLAFEAFIEPSFAELAEAFSFFSSAAVDEMILDLRYNSGGQLNVAIRLASYLAGNQRAGQIFISARHNEIKRERNDTMRFETTSYPVNLSRLFVITTRETASASENIINGLSPYLDVITVGTPTNGKPTGMNVFTDNPKNKFIFAPVTFKLVNAVNFSEYLDGFIPAIQAVDDITRDWGDRQEASVQAIINYLSPGKASLPTPDQTKAVWLEPLRPEWQKNLFINRTVQ